MGFKQLFKVRKPGNGSAFEKQVEAAGKKPLNAGPLKKNDFNAKDKTNV